MVLAIDPGFDRIGVAVLEKPARHGFAVGESGGDNLFYSDCIQTNRKLPHQERLLEIGEFIRKVIQKWQPETLAIEELFFNQNITNALKVSEARGVIIYEAAKSGLEIYEYSPQAIKIAVTGYGKADKTQIESMVRKLITLPSKKMLDDEIDAIALGITHIATRKGI